MSKSLSEPSIGKKIILPIIGGALLVFLFVFFIQAKNSEKDIFYSQADGIAGFSEEVFVENQKIQGESFSPLLFAQGNSVVPVSSPLIFSSPGSLGFAGAEQESEKEIVEYIVSGEDTVSGIAQKFNISTNTIIWANNLKNTNLKIGQKLAVLPVSGVIHEVKKDDTISEIARRYKAKTEEIVSFNGLADESEIFIGDILIIPGGEIPPAPAPAPKPSPGPGVSFAGFIVPTKGYISQRLHWYNAIDIANNCGAPVVASAAGTIQKTGYHSVGGYYVRILHSNGLVTYYGHLANKSIRVVPGQAVSQGARIGDVGNTGYTIGATGCHVHFEVRGGANPFAGYAYGYRF